MNHHLKVTELGRAVARSGLLPETASFLIDFLIERRDVLIKLLPNAVRVVDWMASEIDKDDLLRNERALSFILSHLVFSSPEYKRTYTPAQRFLPYMITEERRDTEIARSTNKLLVCPWDQDVGATNAAELTLDYSEGEPLFKLENRFNGLTSGMIHDLLRDHVAHLKGLADIIDVLSSGELPPDHLYVARLISLDEHRVALRRIVRHVRVRIRQMVVGVPEDVMWMRELRSENGNVLLTRAMALSLQSHGLITLEDILDKGQQDKFHLAMNAVGAGQLQRKQIRAATEAHRANRTVARRDRIRKQLPECDNLANQLFASRDHELEQYLSHCFECVGFKVVARDTNDGPSHFPDFVMKLQDGDNDQQDIVLECKSKRGNGEVCLNEATEVGSKALTHGLNKRPMVTLCQPYVSTDVPRNLRTTIDLAVINGEDLAFALAALKQDKISLQRFRSWITTPGQPTIDDLFGT